MMETTLQQGKAIIFSAPSGAGKTTIVQHLVKDCNFNLSFSVSATSRDIRKGEVDTRDYYYFSVEEFKTKIANNEFFEWQEVYANNYYGTLKTEIDRIWASGKHVIFDVDVVGGMNLKKIFGNKALSIFVKPPSKAMLEQRLRTRSTETEESIARRMGKADWELKQASNFDVELLNDVINIAFSEAETTIANFLDTVVSN
jgi:guanylate kinase